MKILAAIKRGERKLEKRVTGQDIFLAFDLISLSEGGGQYAAAEVRQLS
jgi:hypothetical protein